MSDYRTLLAPECQQCDHVAACPGLLKWDEGVCKAVRWRWAR